jgi:hypothetical protein
LPSATPTASPTDTPTATPAVPLTDAPDVSSFSTDAPVVSSFSTDAPDVSSYSASDDLTDDADGKLHTITSSTLAVQHAGLGYSIGDVVSIGEGLPGWTTPATMSVITVDDNGGITSVEVATGGRFEGSAIEGVTDFNIVNAALLLSVSKQTFRDTSSADDEGRSSEELVALGAGAAVGLVALVAAVLARKNSRNGAASEDVLVLTPTATSAV